MSPELEEELERFFATAMLAVQKFPVTDRESLTEGIMFGFGRAIALAEGPQAVERYATSLRAGGKFGELLKTELEKLKGN